MLNTLEIQNFTCFHKSNLKFSPGLNIIIGENGTGKSHLLKLGYAALYVASQSPANSGKEEKKILLRNTINGIFRSSSINKLFSYKNKGDMNCFVQAKMKNTDVSFKFNFDQQMVNDDLNELDATIVKNGEATPSPVFIPAKEILSLYPGLAYEIENKLLAFDDTYLHLAKALGAPELRGDALEAVTKYAVKIEEITNAICIKSGDRFFLMPFKIEKVLHTVRVTDYPQMEAHLVAEGHRKIGMLSYLMRNGTLQPGTSLFWDEPEANLNPKLIKKLATVLVELSRIMQITIATHSLFLMRELEILQEQKNITNAQYFSLNFEENDKSINVKDGKSPNYIGDIIALNEEISQSTRYLSMGAQENA